MRQLRVAIPGLTFATNGTLNIMVTFAHAETKESYKLLPFAQVEIVLNCVIMLTAQTSPCSVINTPHPSAISCVLSLLHRHTRDPKSVSAARWWSGLAEEISRRLSIDW